MRRSLVPLLTAFAIAGAPAAFGQQQPPAPPPAVPPAPDLGQQQAPQVSDAELETFAGIYVELQEMIGRYEAELDNAESQEQAQEVQMQMQRESFEKIQEHGWTPEQYNQVVQAVNADPDLLQRAVALIEERS